MTNISAVGITDATKKSGQMGTKPVFCPADIRITSLASPLIQWLRYISEDLFSLIFAHLTDPFRHTPAAMYRILPCRLPLFTFFYGFNIVFFFQELKAYGDLSFASTGFLLVVQKLCANKSDCTL